jgi:hypothetical protein
LNRKFASDHTDRSMGGWRLALVARFHGSNNPVA